MPWPRINDVLCNATSELCHLSVVDSMEMSSRPQTRQREPSVVPYGGSMARKVFDMNVCLAEAVVKYIVGTVRYYRQSRALDFSVPGNRLVAERALMQLQYDSCAVRISSDVRADLRLLQEAPKSIAGQVQKMYEVLLHAASPTGSLFSHCFLFQGGFPMVQVLDFVDEFASPYERPAYPHLPANTYLSKPFPNLLLQHIAGRALCKQRIVPALSECAFRYLDKTPVVAAVAPSKNEKQPRRRAALD